MDSQRRFPWFWCWILIVFSAAAVLGAEKVSADRASAPAKSLVGIRLGAWIDQGGTLENKNVVADYPDASFYTEVFYDYRLASMLWIELSMAVASRGDAVYTFGDDQYIGTINLYPMLVEFKLTPPGGFSERVRPFVIVGGGFVFGRQNTQFVQAYGYFTDPYYTDQSRTALTAVFGGGVDIPLSRQLGLTIAGKYHPVKFNDPLVGVTDYSGTTVGVGVVYYLHKK